ncbi:MAG: HIT domain-containing protein [Actinobacteria bacterium]|nr:HIT domain-containing protein [Actinomycetota bacterium]
MLDHLWNGWRAAYVQRWGETAGDPLPVEGGSIFTRILNAGLSDDEAHIVRRGEECFAILNAYPYASGHMLVLPYREVPNLEDLSTAESGELWSLVTQGVRALKAAYSPQGVNVGINLGPPAGGSISDHLHVHVVPRWVGDGNFMTAVANTRTLPESLVDSAAKLREAWCRL